VGDGAGGGAKDGASDGGDAVLPDSLAHLVSYDATALDGRHL